MPDYRTDVYPHRNSLNAFVNALLRGLPSNYTENVELGYGGNRPGSGTIPREMDRIRVRALLDAWNRHISDRYLDYQSVRGLDRAFDASQGRDAAIRQARQLIDRNAPGGGIKFIYNELSNDRDVTYARMNERGDYNWMYSAILNWCDHHCYALPNYIIRFRETMAGVGGGDSALGIVYQAAWQYIHEQYRARIGVYQRYFTERTFSSYLSPF